MATARAAPTPLPLAIAASLLAAAWPWSPWPALVRTPNTQGLSHYFQFDYRPRQNPVARTFDSIAPSPLWRSLVTRAPGSVTVAVAPFRFESDDWLAPAWERESRQTVVAGMLSGGCGAWFFGEVPPDARFRLRHAVHLADAAALTAHPIDFVAWHKGSTVPDAQGVKRPAPEYLTWLHGRLSTPSFEKDGLVVWALTGPAAGAPAVAAAR